MHKINSIIISTLFLALLVINNSCEDPEREVEFEDLAEGTILQFLEENKEEYSSAISIFESAGADITLGAYNPDGEGYTLFLPNNNAVSDFIAESNEFSSLNDLVADKNYTKALCKYHILNMAIHTNDFPYGAFPEPTLSGDYLTVNVIVETDTSYYSINNASPVVRLNKECSNGYVHVVSKVLKPVTKTTYGWIESTNGYSIFKSAIDATGLKDRFDVNTREGQGSNLNITTLVEHDSIFNNAGIFSLDDLISKISPDDDDYTNINNPLYNFVSYHAVNGTYYLADLQKANTNYGTVASMPVNISGLGVDIKINTGSTVYDSVLVGNEYKLIDYITIFYDESNVVTLGGAIHFIDRMLTPYRPTRSTMTFQFMEEPLLAEYAKEPGKYPIEDPTLMEKLTWDDTELTYTKSADASEAAWNEDFITVEGDFTLTYRFPPVVEGAYTAFINAKARSKYNAVIEVYIDGAKIGGIIDLTSGGSSSNPYVKVELGEINFEGFEEHTIMIKPLIPGRFIWDYLRFEPVK